MNAFLFSRATSRSRTFYHYFLNDESFSVSSNEILTPEEIVRFWPLVEAADKLETQSFVDHQCFRLEARKDRFVQNQVDAMGVRRWRSRRLKLVKSRLCGRGYLDRQRGSIDCHSSTAPRISHKLACSLGIQHRLVPISLDVSTAFLQGLRFSEIARKAKELGHEVRANRKVWPHPTS